MKSCELEEEKKGNFLVRLKVIVDGKNVAKALIELWKLKLNFQKLHVDFKLQF